MARCDTLSAVRKTTPSKRLLYAVTLILLGAASATGEQAWVKDYHRLNLRSGPGTEFRIKGAVETGNEVAILERGDRWTRVRVSNVGEGWIPQGYLQSVTPARVRVKAIEEQNDALRGEVGTLAATTSRLEAENLELRDRDTEQSGRLGELSRENVVLRAGARWPHWITGAGILSVGLLGGIVIHSLSGRRSRPRLRL